MSERIDLGELVPGGIRATDRWHYVTSDGSCSRCRKPVPAGDVPLMLWSDGGEDMLVYCEACLAPLLTPRPAQ